MSQRRRRRTSDPLAQRGNPLESDAPAQKCPRLEGETSLETQQHTQADPSKKPRAPSPVPSCVSLKSDASKLGPPNLRDEPPHSDQEESKKPRAPSPVPSCVSLKSDASKLGPPNLRDEPPHSDRRVHKPRAPSPVPSCVSLKSDASKLGPPNLSDEPSRSDQDVHKPRTPSPVPSCVSLKSDASKLGPPNLNEPPLSDQGDPSQSSLTFIVTGRAVKSDEERKSLSEYKTKLKRQCKNIHECVFSEDTQRPLEDVYVDLYIIEGQTEGLDDEHEVLQVEAQSVGKSIEDTQITCNDLFYSEEKVIRAVLTKAAAGMGKTVLVQKLITDWADGRANQDVDVVVVLPFRLLNRIKDRECSFQDLLLDICPELEELWSGGKFEDYQILFICFALDESSLPLNFQANQRLSDVSQKATVDTLVTSLILGSLVPDARIWITSRHVASDQIPPNIIDKVTEVRGFTDQQKDEYFKKRVSDESQALRIIEHIKSLRSLHILCRLPVICWVAATVLEDILEDETSENNPSTVTEMVMQYLAIQTTRRRQKYQSSNVLGQQDDLILKLSKLAFEHLEKGSYMFSEEEVLACGIGVADALVYSGFCTNAFKGESSPFGKMYTFVHITLQEFLAALYVFVSYVKEDTEALGALLTKKQSVPLEHPSLEELLKCAVNRALESKSGHLDLFIRFLHGMAMESNQKVMRGLLSIKPKDNPRCVSNPESLKIAVQNLKDMRRKDISPDRWINLLCCLVEMHDSSVQQEVQAFLNSETGAVKRLKLAHCSALARTLMMAAVPMEDFDLKKYKTSDEGRRRLVPAVRSCKKALLADCKLTAKSCEIVASALKAPRSLLRELDMSRNNLQDSGVEYLSSGLRNSNCKLETLRLSDCGITEKGCKFLASALMENPSHLRELDLTANRLGETGLKPLTELRTIQITH